MRRRAQLPSGPPDRTAYPTAVVYDASAMVRVERLRWWPEGIESQITIESPQPGRDAASLWASLWRARIFVYPERPAPDIPPRRSRFWISQPELQGIHVLHRAEIYADLSDNGKSYTKRTLSGRYWLPHPFVRDTVFCWLVWPEEDVSDAIFPLEIDRWSRESPQTPPAQE